MLVIGVDIGSVKAPSKFAWAAVDSEGRAPVSSGDDPETAVQALLNALTGTGTETGRAVLAVEAPLSVPVPEPSGDEWRGLGRARTGEGNRPWSAGAGSGALATGIAQTAWMLSRLHTLAPHVTVTTQPERFAAGQARLLLVEAFVSGAGKPEPGAAGPHAADAEAAARATLACLADGTNHSPRVACAPRRALNLLAALASWAGTPVPPDELHLEVLVIRTRPAS
ncbi:hypothetical protein ACFVZH_25020 [Streptomyces sp. NPDC059534]|uniref:hypothetical protein n=1 Tax=Streptomyces sp. NPDC059534 TaxID=3346859 RepID=UPI00368D617D